jgi:CheY-like chemotaxis protein
MAEEKGRRMVLVVEDSESCRTLAEMAIAPLAGVTVVPAASAAEALMILRGGAAFRAIVTDLNMPRMDGFELIRTVRAEGGAARVPIVVVSADTDPGTPALAAAAGADAFLAKPYSPALLRRTLERLIDATGT